MLNRRTHILICFFICSLFLSNAYSQFSKEEKQKLENKNISIKKAREYRKENKDFPVEWIIAYEKYNEHNRKIGWDKWIVSPEHAALTSEKLRNRKGGFSDNDSKWEAIENIHVSEAAINKYVANNRLSKTVQEAMLKDFFASEYDDRFTTDVTAWFVAHRITADMIKAKAYPDYLTHFEIYALVTGNLKSEYYKVKLKQPANKIKIRHYRQAHGQSFLGDVLQLFNIGLCQYNILKELNYNKEQSVFDEGGNTLVNKQKSEIISVIDDKTKLIDIITQAEIDLSKLSEAPTDKQKGLLYMEHPSDIYFVANEKNPRIFSAYESDEEDEIVKRIFEAINDYRGFTNIEAGSEIGDLKKTFYVYGYREISTLNNIIEKAKASSYNFSDCALIFGSDHDFKKYQINGLLEVEEIDPAGCKMEPSKYNGFVFTNYEEQKDFIRKLFEEGDSGQKEKISKLTEALINEIRFPNGFHLDIKKIKLLINQGAELNNPDDKHGMTALEAAISGCGEFASIDKKELIKFLIYSGSDISDGDKIIKQVNSRCDGGRGLPIVKFLIEECGVKINDYYSVIVYFEDNPKIKDSKDILDYLRASKGKN